MILLIWFFIFVGMLLTAYIMGNIVYNYFNIIDHPLDLLIIPLLLIGLIGTFATGMTLIFIWGGGF